MLFKSSKIRLFTAALALLMLLSSCAVNMGKDIFVPLVETAVNESEVYGNLEIPMIPRPPKNDNKEEVKEEEKIEETVGVTRPNVGSQGDVFVPYSVPLTVDQQKAVEKIAAKYFIPEELIYGVMWVESKYNVNAVGRNGKYLGIMQIAVSNMKILERYCGVTNLFDFEQCVTAGSYYLSTYAYRYDNNFHVMLLYYHGGYKYANNLLNSGISEDSYTRAVVHEMNRIIDERKCLAASMGVSLKGWPYDGSEL